MPHALRQGPPPIVYEKCQRAPRRDEAPGATRPKVAARNVDLQMSAPPEPVPAGTQSSPMRAPLARSPARSAKLDAQGHGSQAACARHRTTRPRRVESSKFSRLTQCRSPAKNVRLRVSAPPGPMPAGIQSSPIRALLTKPPARCAKRAKTAAQRATIHNNLRDAQVHGHQLAQARRRR